MSGYFATYSRRTYWGAIWWNQRSKESEMPPMWDCSQLHKRAHSNPELALAHAEEEIASGRWEPH